MILEIIKIVLPFIAGGGLHWLLNYRRKRRQINNSFAIEEYDQVDKMVKKYVKTVEDLSNHITEAEKEINELKKLIHQLELENEALRNKLSNHGTIDT
ncbi:MAG: hypothetical protein AAFO07_04230 [Bacteroidota bacterium]